MKLSQNAKEMVLLNIDGLGLIVGEIRFNRQTETIGFVLEKAAFFDLYFPCMVMVEKNNLMLQPHILASLSTSSIRVQRSRVSCFVMESELNPALIYQYNAIIASITGGPVPPPSPKPPGKGVKKSNVVSIQDKLSFNRDDK
ncbi:MAG: hypothetical protein PHC35_01940 [Deltaproteobacteria bacterium]|jgi:hypothetical protein|nr:hypothetical protein [Deltaproteobacteria bacterium]